MTSEARKAAMRRTRREKRAALTAIKLESGCVDCGYRDSAAVLHFDHLDRTTKVADVGRMVRSYGWAKLLAEVAKCEVVCFPCHVARTARRGDHLPAPPAPRQPSLFDFDATMGG